MQKVKAFTLTELLVVMGILVLLAGIGFHLSAPMREQARQRVCASQLSQIGKAFFLYSADNPNHPEVPGLQGWDVTALKDTRVLNQYLSSSREVWQCPNMSAMAKKKYPSLYTTHIDLHVPTTPAERAADPGYASRWDRTLKMISSRGSSFPVIYCPTHEETFYRVRTRGVDPSLLPDPLIVALRPDASVVIGRDKDAIITNLLELQGLL